MITITKEQFEKLNETSYINSLFRNKSKISYEDLENGVTICAHNTINYIMKTFVSSKKEEDFKSEEDFLNFYYTEREEEIQNAIDEENSLFLQMLFNINILEDNKYYDELNTDENDLYELEIFCI